MSEELAYSIHLGSDKNKTAKAKQTAKSNPSGETSLANNGIQNATQLSKVNKHNLRDYDNDKDLIKVIYGTDNLYQDVQDLYLQEFEQAQIEYNEKQTCEDRKIDNYFKHISSSKLWDLACEFIVELGDMDFWRNKDMGYRTRMIGVYNEQVQDLMKIVPEFKIANAKDYNEFIKILQDLDYVVTDINETLSIRREPYKRNTRIERQFANNYSKENIYKRILETQPEYPYSPDPYLLANRSYERYNNEKQKHLQFKDSISYLIFHYEKLLGINIEIVSKPNITKMTPELIQSIKLHLQIILP